MGYDKEAEDAARQQRAVIYVDARNLFKRMLERWSLDWFDIEGYFLSRYSSFAGLREIKYFTSEGRELLAQPLRTYHEAIVSYRKASKLRVYHGTCEKREEKGCLHRECRFGESKHYHQPEFKEKQTDVWMAVEVLADVFSTTDPVRAVLLVTDDLDFLPLVKKLKTLREEGVLPGLSILARSPSKAIGELHETVDSSAPLSKDELWRHRLPRRFLSQRDNSKVFEIPRKFRLKELRGEWRRLVTEQFERGQFPEAPPGANRIRRIQNVQIEYAELLREQASDSENRLRRKREDLGRAQNAAGQSSGDPLQLQKFTEKADYYLREIYREEQLLTKILAEKALVEQYRTPH